MSYSHFSEHSKYHTQIPKICVPVVLIMPCCKKVAYKAHTQGIIIKMWFLDIYWASLLILVPCVTLVLGRNIVLRTFGRLSTSTATAAAITKKSSCEDGGTAVYNRLNLRRHLRPADGVFRRQGR